MKKLFGLTIVLLTVLTLTGCTAPSGAEMAPSDIPPVINSLDNAKSELFGELGVNEGNENPGTPLPVVEIPSPALPVGTDDINVLPVK
ncbi:hypothetical protein JXA05_00375 [Candidatus Peregrinibacteria bacterium]|nr:hypothetical protein [Candidatus Peregrinibacteria bacterium]